ncbi:MAG: metallophosphoesterase [Chloroflexota bacterium]|nr:metallophosphoesterase [Chloroflexota bacterium]
MNSRDAMTRDEIKGLLNEAEKRFEQESNLIEMHSGRVIFVGDTHGDIEATERVFDKYLNAESSLIFLGDYVDRGSASEDNLHLLLKTKLENPERLFMLMGNHEGRPGMKFYPADFWERLDPEMYDRYAAALTRLPLVASTPNGIIALHGALPEVHCMADINGIEFGSRQWQHITWGDWQETNDGCLRDGGVFGRPQFGQAWFEDVMNRLGKNVLIRSHQPGISPVIYNGRCLTIFTSNAYRSGAAGRTVAIADLDRGVNTVDDLIIETI